jgi:DNA ligase-associated metallophosphoesterase
MTGTDALQAESRTGVIAVAGVDFLADPDGALVWPDERLLVVSDMHLEKGSAFAARGVLLPPYDTAATLARLAALILRYDPRTVIALGDSFHDEGAHERLCAPDYRALAGLQRRRDWIWVAGNHDPAPPHGLQGACAEELAIGAVAFRHEPTGAYGEIAGHLHPFARVAVRGRTVSRRCFAADRDRLVMPAFGAYAGGLNIREQPFAEVFSGLDFTAHLLGAGRLHAIPATRCG